MTKSIYTVVPDVYELMKRKDGWFTDELADAFSHEVSRRLQLHHNDYQGPSRLRLSQMGPRCPKALWTSIHHPEEAEPLPPWAMIKYSYGHILEAYAITLIKASGHTVEGEQDELVVDDIVGHRDCVVDGAILDVKSCSSFSFKKFEDGSLKDDDAFGYLDQLDGYLCGSLQDPLVTVKDRAFILAIDKQLGKMILYEHKFRESSIRQRIRDYKLIVGRGVCPECQCGTKPQGASGNIQLDTKASYNVYKHSCFPELRTFLYSNGPVYLTKVVRVPDVPEVDKHGRRIH